jgi:hypothetical protein
MSFAAAPPSTECCRQFQPQQQLGPSSCAAALSPEVGIVTCYVHYLLEHVLLLLLAGLCSLRWCLRMLPCPGSTL